MERFEMGKKVGVICADGIVYGKVRSAFGFLIEVSTDEKYLKKFERRRVFPAWEGNYTEDDIANLSYWLDEASCGIGVLKKLSNFLNSFDECSGEEIFNFANELQKTPIPDCSELTTEIYNFMDWANHGFCEAASP